MCSDLIPFQFSVFFSIHRFDLFFFSLVKYLFLLLFRFVYIDHLFTHDCFPSRLLKTKYESRKDVRKTHDQLLISFSFFITSKQARKKCTVSVYNMEQQIHQQGIYNDTILIENNYVNNVHDVVVVFFFSFWSAVRWVIKSNSTRMHKHTHKLTICISYDDGPNWFK